MAGIERRGDPERGLDLLWRGLEQANRGPRQRLSLDQLATAAVELADADGLDALSIRRVAQALGVGPMSLYTYVPSKVELLELMIDRVFAEIGSADRGLPWREQVHFLAAERWRMYHRHPWVLQSNLSRIPLGPNVLDAAEGMYAALAGAGLTPRGVVGSVGVIESYLQGATRTEVIEAQEASRTGVSYDEYWAARDSFWQKYFDANRYPEHLRLWQSGGFDELPGYRFGLARILDGIEALARAT